MSSDAPAAMRPVPGVRPDEDAELPDASVHKNREVPREG